ncbi:ligand-binding sensor domain-containing protein [Aestuariirhabdus litorea]|uniref:Regulator n=1 Tax=Aestuariirhabdus litorea TaxID=2528527 RepID=A0A3P3VS43_9GAMM|nr:two-component regulator propeller domain-containing protein [Aestuariirhabdus litorea]RRJ85264.1 regulator [Aestuariirhabdus litorea]RWW98486.1 regulator [Endozoicomonadaceae bacterium GTF-13]
MSWKIKAGVALGMAGLVAMVLVNNNRPQESTEHTPVSAAKLPAGATLPPGHMPIEQGLGIASTTPVDHPTIPQGKFTQFEMGNRNVKSILPVGESVWIGSSGGALRYDLGKNDYQHYNTQNGLLANGVFNIAEVNGKIAVGTYGGGLSILEDEEKGRWKIYNVPEGLGDAFVYGTLQMTNGDIWIATWTGANRIKGGKLDDPAAWEVYTVENTDGGVPNDWVYGLAEGLNGDLWMATEGGLALYRDGQWKNWRHADGLGAPYELMEKQNPVRTDPAQFSEHHARQKIEMGLEGVSTAYNPNYIISLVVDDEGVVWAGTWGAGLSRFDGERWTTLTMDDGLPNNHIFALYIDSKKRLWVGTSKGLARREADGSFRVFTRADGLYSDAVFSMSEESEGVYWIGSFGGVARITSLD